MSHPASIRAAAPARPLPGLVGFPPYRWVQAVSREVRFIEAVFQAFGVDRLRLWVEAGTPAPRFDRRGAEGMVTGEFEWAGGKVAFVWSDFRVNAAAYCAANSRRLIAFLQHLGARRGPPTPLLYFINSAGLSLVEGRALFADAFAIWPALRAYAEGRPVLTCASGKVLGLAPLLYGLGHYRVAVAEGTHLNLTGPEVIARFFGAGADFDRDAAAERCYADQDLIHELVPSVAAGCARFQALLSRGRLGATTGAPVGARTTGLLEQVAEGGVHEVIPGWSERVRLFIGTHHGRALGIFVNPLERSNNMIDVRTLEKYAAGLELFAALGLPIVSLLDAPGIDPRSTRGAADNIRTIVAVGNLIIGYPWARMGVIAGRCFGGAATLSFPKVFGGQRSIALEGCNLGMMHPAIVSELLRGAPRLLAQWRAVAERQGPDCRDLLATGMLDALIPREALGGEIDRFLARAWPR